jgi:hypothetical protein
MKKILFFLIALIGFAAMSAQTVTLPAMKVGWTYQSVDTDYTLSAATVRNFIFTAPQHYPTTQDYVIKLDTIVGTNHNTVEVALYGQKFAIQDDWTIIGSAVTWTVDTEAESADTTIIISNATANRYKNYKVAVTGVGAGAVTKIAAQELKLFLE